MDSPCGRGYSISDRPGPFDPRDSDLFGGADLPTTEIAVVLLVALRGPRLLTAVQRIAGRGMPEGLAYRPSRSGSDQRKPDENGSEMAR